MDAYGRPLTPSPGGPAYQQQPYQQQSYPQYSQPLTPAQQPAYYQGDGPAQAPAASPTQQQTQGASTTPPPQPARQQTQGGAPRPAPTTTSNGAAAGPNTTAPPADSEQPGFFGRLFGGKAAPKPQVPAPKVQVVEEAQTANCLPSKPLTADEMEQIRNRPLGKSLWPCLNPPDAAVPGAEGAEGGSAGGVPGPPPIPMVSQDITGPPPEINLYGPWLRFGGYDPFTRQWSGSVLVLMHQARCPSHPTLTFKDAELGVEAEVQASHLDHYQGWNFWRFDLVVQCGMAQRKVQYSVRLPTDHFFTHHHHYTFLVPGVMQKWRWGFYSCNGFHDPAMEQQAGGIQPLWRDVMHTHQQHPMHLMVGGGDQIYNDPVWAVPALAAWCRLPDSRARVAHPFTQDMVNQVFDYYFKSYVKHWSQPLFKDALSSIPQLMVWDDHDIFDGFGSYPDYLQACPVFQGVYFIARKFYALFQQHTTVERAVSDNKVFGEFAWHQLTCLGASTALLVLDARSERTPRQIVRPASWAMIQQRLVALPPSVKHVIVLAGVPVIYPKIPVAESALTFLGTGRSRMGVVQMLQKSGLADSLMSPFGTVDILDDLTDHWNAESHQAEKLMLVQMMQALSLARGFRFSLLSGDVHVAAVGRFMSHPKKNLRQDHRFVPQIISSAIGNLPPPDGVVKALTSSAKPRDLDKDTRELMVNVFGVQQVLCARRNWLVVSENGMVQGPGHADGALVFQFRVESARRHHDTRPDTFELAVPPLDLPMGPSMQLAGLSNRVPVPPPGAAPGVHHPVPAPMAPGAYAANTAQAGSLPWNSVTAPPAVGAPSQVAPPGHPMPVPAPPPSLAAAGVKPAGTSPPPGTPAWLLNQSATPGTFGPSAGVAPQQSHPTAGNSQQQPPPAPGGYQQQPPPPAAGGYQQQPPPAPGGYQQQPPPPAAGGYQQQPPPVAGGYQQQPPPVAGGYQQQPPPPVAGGYQQPPPPVAGGYQQQAPPPAAGGYQQQPTPVAGGYQQQPPPPAAGGYQQQPPPVAGGYQQQPPPVAGGYQQQPPPPVAGGYQQPPPPVAGGYQQQAPPPAAGGYQQQPPPVAGGYQPAPMQYQAQAGYTPAYTAQRVY